MLWDVNVGNLAELLMVALTCVATVTNIFLWLTTRQTVQILVEQVKHQVASSYSLAQYSIVDAHRQLFLGILNNPSLLASFTKANNLDPKDWELQKIAEFLINQVLIGYLNFVNGIISSAHFEGFKRDAKDVFAYQSVQNHWKHVRTVHSDDFCQFVETELLPQEIVASRKDTPCT